MKGIFPSAIKKLPQADVPLKGMNGFLVQGRSNQVVFSEYKKTAVIPEHSHAAQWGVVLKGKIQFTIGRRVSTFTKGDTFYIPNGVKHSSKVFAKYADVQFFDEKSRFKAKR